LQVKYRRLGRYGLKVSEIALGNWLTQGRTLDQEATNSIVKKAFDLGINFFDTANVYTGGKAEVALGQAIKDLRREDLVIATKCFFAMSDAPNDRGLSRKHITESVHASLRRLEVDYIDLMQFHRFDPETPKDETIRAIDDLIRQGKVLYWGTSEWPAHQITGACHIARELRAHPPVSNQPIYNLLVRGIESSVIPACDEQGMGQVVFSPLAQGVLTGKYLPGQQPPAGTRAADDNANSFMDYLMQDDVLERVQRLKGFALEAGAESLAQFSIAFCLRNPSVSSAIVGASSLRQLEENVKGAEATFDEQVWEEAVEIAGMVRR
jgi:aryl-alcohol dehydrogenase-like predicted oxidoreductase